MNGNSKDCQNKSNNMNNDNKYNNLLAKCLFSLPPKQFSLLSSLLGILLIDNLDLDQQNALGNFIVNVGQAILTAAAQGAIFQNSNSNNDYIRQQIQILKEQILNLEKQLDN